ncbi:MAG: hypothetical protein IJN13_00390 [Bacilli bacterium]|nr:hypothetical protein [Bacilli bacterium]
MKGDLLFDIKLYRKPFSLYGEYEQLDYKNTFSILSECINNGNYASIKVNKTFYHIGNNTHFRYFVEEFGWMYE